MTNASLESVPRMLYEEFSERESLDILSKSLEEIAAAVTDTISRQSINSPQWSSEFDELMNQARI